MSGHTPGPWSVDDGDIMMVKSEDYDIANTAFLSQLGAAECVANALLIAAAPDMLEALKRLRSGYVRDGDVGNGRLKIILDAIAKAEGTA